ncbi:MAG: 3-hydroxyacyl-CoA dehydrogenase family protein [Thermoplasmataceae archaeon]
MFKNVGVVGLGTMGASVAELMAFNNLEVTMVDQNDELVNRGLKTVERILDSYLRFSKSRAEKEIRRIEALGITLSSEQKAEIEKHLSSDFNEKTLQKALDRLHPTTDFSELRQCEHVVEAVFEKIDIKMNVFRRLSESCSPECIISSNSSSLSITKLASCVTNPQRVILTHFFNPPYTLPLIEIVRAMQTSEDTESRVLEFYSSIKNHRTRMKPIRVKEVPGFLVNRLLVPMLNEACFALDEGIASRDDIDTAMKLGAGMPMGPLELTDMVGVDIALDVMEILQREYGDPKYRPSTILRKMVDAGKTGRKSSSGFYEYNKKV